MRARSALSIVSALIAAACAPQREARSPVKLDVASIRRSVAEVRGLPERAPTPVELLDDGAFVALLEHRSERGGAEGGRSTRTLGEAAELVSEARAAELEDTLGFYDLPGRTIFLRVPSEENRDRLPLSWILAHELTHALQHQNFTIPELSSFGTVDERLAFLALVEGDAMVTMLAHGAQQNFVPIPRAIRIAMRNLGRGEADRLEHFGAPPEKLERASPIVRARMVFPYAAGTAFVGAIHHAGGFPLVNQMYARPPRTTEQVLHPEKYLGGEGPVEVEAPEPPAGLRVIMRGRMGELGVIGMLESCVPPEEARQAAAGWGGDAFTMALTQQRQSTIFWGTAWDTPQDAAEFARAIRQCADTRAAGQVFHDGYRVSVIAGPPVSNGAALHRTIVGLRAVRAPASPPLSIASLPPLPPLPDIPPAMLSPGRYDSPRLDLALPVPPGFKASLVDGGLLLEGARGLMEVDFSPAIVTTESTAKLYRDFLDSLGIHAARLEVVSNDRIETPVGAGLERTWAAPGTVLRLQVLILPVCNRNGSVVFKRLWSEPHAGRLLDWVVQSARRIQGSAPPVCAEL